MRLLLPLTFLLTASAGVGCGEPRAEPTTDIEIGKRFVGDREFRRNALEQSVVNPDNAYSALRLEEYARKHGGWGELPVYDPRILPVTTDDLGSFDAAGRRASTGGNTAISANLEWTHESLMEVGQWGFENYPMIVDARLAPAAESRENADEVGLWVDGSGRLGGLVAAEDDGQEALAWTCATCHAAMDDSGTLVLGRTNVAFDSGRLYRLGDAGSERVDAWGAGRVDTSRDGTDNPVLISDVRNVRHQSHLHHTATLRNNLAALAIRVETLLIVSQRQQRRPPRGLAFALAYYMWNLSPPTPTPVAEGRDVFEATCARCHHTDGSVAAPVNPSTVGTDPSLQDAPGRGTGVYRIPSLVGVSERALLLHDGSVSDVEQLLDPARPSEIEGHEFGHELSDDERERLLRFVRSF